MYIFERNKRDYPVALAQQQFSIYIQNCVILLHLVITPTTWMASQSDLRWTLSKNRKAGHDSGLMFVRGPSGLKRRRYLQTSAFPRLTLSLTFVLAMLVVSSSGLTKKTETGNWAMARVSGLETSIGKAMPTNLEELLEFAGVPDDVDAENYCLAQAIYFEARGETVDGQFAVGRVVLNRVSDSRYPSTICGVVFQNQKWVDRCQFSFACDEASDNPREAGSWMVARRIANLVRSNWLPDDLGAATHYHADYVRPGWADRMDRTASVGRHIFYREDPSVRRQRNLN
jgi:hypothetical protein